MMATTPPSCLRPPPDPPSSPCMYALLEALCPVIPPEPPDPPDSPLLLALQSVLSSVVSPSSLHVVVHPTLLFGAALLCTSKTTGSTQPDHWLARSVWFCISEAPTPLHAASDPLINAKNPFCYASALFISAEYPSCSDTRSLTFDVISFGSKVSCCCLCNQSEPFFNTLHGVYTFMSCLKEADGEQFWVNFVKLLRFQYGNIGSRSLRLNSTIAFSSTSVKHIQQVITRHLGTQSVFRRLKLSPSRPRLPYSVVKPKRFTKEIIVLILVDMVQILAIKSLSNLFSRVHIAQFQSFSYSASEPSFMLFNVKLSQLGLRLLEIFISAPFTAETIATQSAVCMAITLELSTLKVLSDSLTLIRAISGNIQSKEIIGIVKDILSISSGFAAISFYLFSRSDNLITDVLAKLFKLISFCIELHDLGHRFGLISSF